MVAEYKKVWIRHTHEGLRVAYEHPIRDTAGWTEMNQGSIYRLRVNDVLKLTQVVYDVIGRVAKLRGEAMYFHVAAATKGFRFSILKSGHSCIWYRYVKEILPITKEELPLFLHLETKPYMETLLRKKAI